MSTAEPLPDNIRRIAVLVSSVDSATAHQLLLHLPTSVAKQVRRALQNLGPVSAGERQRILAEFQSTAARQNKVAPARTDTSAPASTPTPQPFSHADAHGAPLNGFAQPAESHPAAPIRAYSLAEHSERGGSPLYPDQTNGTADASQPTWKRMDIRALSHFLRGERATVIAVVLNQLSPETGVALLQLLPASIHREVLQAISNLQDIDAEAMQSIEEHLAERLLDYEQQITSEAKGTRRVAALLAAAPPELQETWSRFVHLAITPTDLPMDAQAESSAKTKSPMAGATTFHVPAASPSAYPQEPLQQPTSTKTTPAAVAPQTPKMSSTDESMQDDEPMILPFPGAKSRGIKEEDERDLLPLSDTDRSLIQLEFESILSLSTHQLAQVLTAAESHTVLLALAGASPAFMKRFYAMLTKTDAKALASRLSKIGPLKLRDIDEAQRSIAELAAKLRTPGSQRSNLVRPARVAA